MTSDLDDLRQRAIAAQHPTVLPSCALEPEDPMCMPTTVACDDNPNCDGFCDNGTCRPETCRDTALSLNETGIDCGGSQCAACVNGKACQLPTDCTSGICEHSMCVAQASDPVDDLDAGPTTSGTGGQPGVDSGPEGGTASDCIPGCLCMTIDQTERIFCSELKLSWAGASSFCQMHDMLLTPIETRTENDALGAMAEWLQLSSFWIGASDRSEEGDWDWTDGANLWSGGPANCPDGAVEGPDSRCYLATPSDNYTRAYESCLAEGPEWSLVTIHSLEENEFVQELIDTTATMRNAQYHAGWIGANDLATEGTWGWVLADPEVSRVTPFWMGGSGGQKVDSATFTNWNGSNPGGGMDENCASMEASNGRWSDNACGFNAYMGICEGPLRGPVAGTYHSFAENEPQLPDCLSYNTLDLHWYAQDCTLAKPFVCSAP
jgi:hypothetical protein